MQTFQYPCESDGEREPGESAAHLIVQEVVHLAGGPVVRHHLQGQDETCHLLKQPHLEAVVVHVEYEVLAHDGEPDQRDVSVPLSHLAHCSRVAHRSLLYQVLVRW